LAAILFHAGMSKTGSTSLQHWLGGNVGTLRKRGMTAVRIQQSGANGPITIAPAAEGSVVSRLVPGANAIETRPSAIGALCAALDDCAGRLGDLFLTSESYEVVFQRREPEVLAHLDALAARHAVRVVYYVRPQHRWLESGWSQWGFRQPRLAPSAWIRHQTERINYLATLAAVREHAPRVGFDVRPFRPDLLTNGDVVDDFAGAYLGGEIGRPVADAEAENRSLPLDVTIMLRDAPPGLFWSGVHDNKRFYRLKRLISQWDVPESAEVARSRAILHRYAYDTFEADNRKLIASLGWATDAFITPDDAPPDGAGELAELDELWRSGASAAARSVLYAALDALLAASEPGGSH
jgi:hypothetical protein